MTCGTDTPMFGVASGQAARFSAVFRNPGLTVSVGGCATHPGPGVTVSGADPGEILMSVEVFDTATGVAQVAVTPAPLRRMP